LGALRYKSFFAGKPLINRALLRKKTYEDKAFYDSRPNAIGCMEEGVWKRAYGRECMGESVRKYRVSIPTRQESHSVCSYKYTQK